MKILTILGTRPEIIRLSLIMKKLDEVCDHRILHTGQNYTDNLNKIFFEQLNLRKPDVYLEAKGSLADQLSTILTGVEKEIKENRPDKVLILGDTNSSLACIVCERMGVPVYHMEAGNRCFDLEVPEERNRKIIDHTCSYNLPYTNNSKENLLNEGLPKNKIFVTGNPIKEVIDYYWKEILICEFKNNKKEFEIKNNYENEYILVTCHRSETVDNKERLSEIISALQEISKEKKILFPCHPKTQQRLKEFNINTQGIDIIDPLGFIEFLSLMINSFCVIGDSGTATAEESAILGIPAIMTRNATERPETIENGNCILSGLNKDSIINCYKTIKEFKRYNSKRIIPYEYNTPNVSEIVVKILMGK
jgi:UDP-N-acetylglucosamine 2-epimerase (non-hydrolysing)